MNTEFLRKQAEQGKEWAKNKLEQENAGENEENSKDDNLNHILYGNMDNIVIQGESGDKIVAFRCPTDLLNKLQQHKQISCTTGSSIIKQALSDYFYWVDKLNELKLEQAKEKSKWASA